MEYTLDKKSLETIQLTLASAFEIIGNGTYPLSSVNNALNVRKACADLNNQIEDILSEKKEKSDGR